MISIDPAALLSPSWCRALTLAERIEPLAQKTTDSSPDGSAASLGQKRLQRWQTEPQFTADSILAQRLAVDDLDQERLSRILGSSAEDLHEAFLHRPSWFERLAAAYAQPAGSFVNIQPGEEELGFLEIVQPLVDQACDELAAAVSALGDKFPDLPYDPRTIEDVLLANLLDPLLLRLSRTMVLELNVARLQGLLEGDTPLERFYSFIEGLRQAETSLAILAEYPVLGRQLALCITQWQEVSFEFLERLCADWSLIQEHFGAEIAPGVLQELIGGAGDTHRGGRSVMIARFESGFQVVYKPKSLAVDAHFQELLQWVNGRGYEPPLRALTVLDRGDYGWVEFVQNEECHSSAEIERFYYRLGSYLALLYAINASDFHLENLIASGEQPMLIDLETLFNPNFERFEESEAGSAAAQAMVNSVLSVGMLPQRLWSGEDYGGIDISGLGGAEGQLSPDRLPRPAAAGTDTMHFERERVPLEGESNRPRLNGVETSAVDYVPSFLSGFRAMYDLLLHNRDELLAYNGPLASFDQDEIRVLIRPTRTYDQLLFESFHPDTLRDALDRGLLFDRLWITVARRPFMARVIRAEQDDLWQGDIPVFTTRPDSLFLYSAAGEAISEVLTECGMAIARRRIAQFSDQGRLRQEWFIRSSLATLVPYDYGAEFEEKGNYRLQETDACPEMPELLGLARSAADYLLETAVLNQDEVTWLGLELLADENWDISPAGMDLANGLPGIALFLGYAGAVLEEDQYTGLARRAVTAVQRYSELFAPELPGIGAFAGWGGILYCLTHFGALWQDEAILDQAEGLVAVIARFIDQDEEYSLLDGAAGGIGSLLALQHVRPAAKTLETAVACGDHLLAQAQESNAGLGWLIPRYGPQALLGFGHGAAGIAWALLELSAVSGLERFKAAALRAISYERSFYSAEAQNWPDLRRKEGGGAVGQGQPRRYPASWSCGAAGIGLARLRALAHLQDTQLQEEIHTALHTTLAQGFGRSHCLNHGDLGNLELLMEAERWLGDPDEAQFGRMKAMVVESIGRHGRQSGAPGGVEMPGLLLGSAGIGYQLLRLAVPERVPAILRLAPPPDN